MSFELNLSGIADIQEAKLAPVGLHVLTCVGAQPHEKDGAITSIRLIFSVDSEENYANIFDYMAIPVEGDDSDKAEFKALMMKRRFHYLGMNNAIEEERLDIEDMVGQETINPLGLTRNDPSEENNNREGRSITWPNLPTEE